MSSSVRVLDFFVVEAAEYIDQMDATLNTARARTLDADALGLAARRLRGSATMARQTAIAAVAAGVERVARELRERRLAWGPGTSAALVAAVDDLRLLVRGARSWSALEEQRARARVQELAVIAPPPPTATPAGVAHVSGSRGSFLSAETLDLSRSLDALGPGAAPAVIAPVTERVRALRGVADVRDMPPLPEVLEAVETTLKSIELGGAASTGGPKETALFGAAAAVLRRASRDIAAHGRPAPNMPELAPFESALTAVADETGRADRIVPISELYHNDGGLQVVSAAPHPPTTPAERFRLEVVSLAEHLRGVVAEARAQKGIEHRERLAREVRNAVRALGATANSFGEKLVARFAAEWSTRAAALEEGALAALDAAAALFSNPGTSAAEIARGLERLASGRNTPPTSALPAARARGAPFAAAAPVPAPTVAAAPTFSQGPGPTAVTRSRVRTPTGPALRALLQDGIAGLSELEARPLSEPTPLPDTDVVPIEQLLYHGRDALSRAAELREQLLRQGDVPSRDVVQELFDLIDLALVE